MNRRNFIKRGALFVPAIFMPKIIRAAPAFANPAFFRARPASGVVAPDITTGLIIRYALDDNAGNTSVADSSGNGHTGTATTNTSTLHVAGQVGSGAFLFNGTNQSIDSGYIWSASDHNGTLSCWFKTTASGNNFSILSSYNGQPGIVGLAANVNGKVNAGFYDTSGNSVVAQADSVGAVNDGIWHHIVAVLNGTTLQLYIDGIARDNATNSSLTGVFSSGASASFIVASSHSAGGEFPGSLDEMRIYNRALSAADAAALYAFASQWFDSIDPATTDTSFSQGDSGYTFSLQITLSTGGVAKKIRIKFGTIVFDGTGFKIALYDSSGSTLLASTTGTVNIADSNTVKEFAISPVSVTATTYMVAFKAQANTGLDYAAKSGTSATAQYDHPTYASFPASTLATPFANPSTASAGILVESA